MNLIRSASWALYNRFLSTLGFVLGLAIAGAGVWFWGIPAGEAVLDGASPQSVATQAAIGSLAVSAGFYVWRLGSSVAFYRTVIGATERRIKKHSGTAQVKADLMQQFDDRFDELRSDLEATRQAVANDDTAEQLREDLEATRQAVEELEAALDDNTTDGAAASGSASAVPNHHETIPDSTGTEERPEASPHRQAANSEDGHSVPVPGHNNVEESAADDDQWFGDGTPQREESFGSSEETTDDAVDTSEDEEQGSFGSGGSREE
jgi:hypothetical protein